MMLGLLFTKQKEPRPWEDHPFADLFLIKMARCAGESEGPEQES